MWNSQQSRSAGANKAEVFVSNEVFGPDKVRIFYGFVTLYAFV